MSRKRKSSLRSKRLPPKVRTPRLTTEERNMNKKHKNAIYSIQLKNRGLKRLSTLIPIKFEEQIKQYIKERIEENENSIPN